MDLPLHIFYTLISSFRLHIQGLVCMKVLKISTVGRALSEPNLI